MDNWHQDTLYHLFPLGALGAPARNDFAAQPVSRLPELYAWLGHLDTLGIKNLFLGPIFESTAHGYDTADYFRLDRRLGRNEEFGAFSKAAHERGFRLILDGVFHHVGRDFWAFKDVLANAEASAYKDWFYLDFAAVSPHGDAFAYEGWAGHFDLVKLNLNNAACRAHLFAAVEQWLVDFDLDGLRLDAADVLDKGFQRELGDICRRFKPDFWLLGEVVHGTYGEWLSGAGLDAVTNYALYKGLYSSHNDHNYFELAHTLKRQFAEGGGYQAANLCTFADNHDQPRIASRLHEPKHLDPLYLLLFSMPGVPALYYGSEAGLEGVSDGHSDAALRPALNPHALRGQHHLFALLARLQALRKAHPALQQGGYQELLVAAEQFAFMRETAAESLVVVVNSSAEAVQLDIALPASTSAARELLSTEAFADKGADKDLDTDSKTVALGAGRLRLELPAHSGRLYALPPRK